MGIENDKNCYIRWWKSTRILNLVMKLPYSIFEPVLEGHPNIEFSDNIAIFDIWPPNFEYTVRLPYNRSYGACTPISDFTGRGHFVTYIGYLGTKWLCKFEVIYLNPEMNIFDIFVAASFEYAVYSNLAATYPLVFGQNILLKPRT